VLASFPVASLNHDLPSLGNPKSDSISSDDALDRDPNKLNRLAV